MDKSSKAEILKPSDPDVVTVNKEQHGLHIGVGIIMLFFFIFGGIWLITNATGLFNEVSEEVSGRLSKDAYVLESEIDAKDDTHGVPFNVLFNVEDGKVYAAIFPQEGRVYVKDTTPQAFMTLVDKYRRSLGGSNVVTLDDAAETAFQRMNELIHWQERLLIRCKPEAVEPLRNIYRDELQPAVKVSTTGRSTAVPEGWLSESHLPADAGHGEFWGQGWMIHQWVFIDGILIMDTNVKPDLEQIRSNFNHDDQARVMVIEDLGEVARIEDDKQSGNVRVVFIRMYTAFKPVNNNVQFGHLSYPRLLEEDDTQFIMLDARETVNAVSHMTVQEGINLSDEFNWTNQAHREVFSSVLYTLINKRLDHGQREKWNQLLNQMDPEHLYVSEEVKALLAADDYKPLRESRSDQENNESTHDVIMIDNTQTIVLPGD